MLSLFQRSLKAEVIGSMDSGLFVELAEQNHPYGTSKKSKSLFKGKFSSVLSRANNKYDEKYIALSH